MSPNRDSLIIQHVALYSYAQWKLVLAISLCLDKVLVLSDAWNDSGPERETEGDSSSSSSPTPNPNPSRLSTSPRFSLSLFLADVMKMPTLLFSLFFFSLFFSDRALRFNTFPRPCFSRRGRAAPVQREHYYQISSSVSDMRGSKLYFIPSIPSAPFSCSGMKCANGSHYCSRSVQQAADRSGKTDRRSNLSTSPLVWAATLLLSPSHFFFFSSLDDSRVSQGLRQSPCFSLLKGKFAPEQNLSSDRSLSKKKIFKILYVLFDLNYLRVPFSTVVFGSPVVAVVCSDTKRGARRSKTIWYAIQCRQSETYMDLKWGHFGLFMSLLLLEWGWWSSTRVLLLARGCFYFVFVFFPPVWSPRCMISHRVVGWTLLWFHLMS